MTYLPSLVDLPIEIPETDAWPELSAHLGSDGDGITSPARRWLTIATLHRSALYEDRRLSGVVARQCLSLFESVGSAVLECELRIAIDRQAPDWRVPRRNEEKARLIGPARRALIELLGVGDNARLGAGEWLQLTRGQATRSVETVTLQLLGWWSLVLGGNRIRNMIRRVHADLVSDAIVVGTGWRSLFLQHFGGLSPQFSYTQSGPDHARTFEATVTTRDGRSSTGSAARKKDATHLACHAYLATYAPHVLRPPATVGRLRALPELPVFVEHKRLATLFGVSDARLFSKALTHTSWVFENTTHRDPRVSNEVLANLGSAVVGLAVARTKAALLLSETTQPDPDLSMWLAVPTEDLAPLGHALGLPAVCRLGAGQHKHGVSTEMLANFVQAVLAAAYIEAGDAVTFEDRMPAAAADFLIAHGGRSTRDAATRLQELAAELDLEWTWADRRSGRDHAHIYHNTIRITDGAVTVVVEGSGPTRAAAKKAAAAVAVDTARLRSESTVAVSRPDVARFFLARQLEVLAAKPNRWPRWQQHNVLGARYIADRDWVTFARWVDNVQRAGLFSTQLSTASSEALAAFYQRAARTGGARPQFAATLSRVVRWVASAKEDNRLILETEPWEDLIALTAAHSVWLTAHGAIDLADLLQRWAHPERRRADVRLHVEGPAEARAQAGTAARRLLEEFRPAAEPGLDLHVTLIPGSPVHEIRLSPDGWSPGSAPLVTMVCEAAAGVAVEQHARSLVLRIAGREPTGSGWLWDAAIRTRATDDSDVELGRLLHDLKNEVTGARVALARPTTTRTEQLEAELDASKHIDSATAIAVQLVDAELLYTVARAGSCDLASFLRGYSSDQMKRQPPTIRVIPPETTTPAHVAVSVDVLRGALDNLVKNAAEAMSNGGQIEFDYTVLDEDDVALLEVRDTGPGLPDDVIAALHANAPAPSSKRHGSGLGLHGVIRMVRRAGGDLIPLRTANGGAWLIKLPLAGKDAPPHE